MIKKAMKRKFDKKIWRAMERVALARVVRVLWSRCYFTHLVLVEASQMIFI